VIKRAELITFAGVARKCPISLGNFEGAKVIMRDDDHLRFGA